MVQKAEVSSKSTKNPAPIRGNGMPDETGDWVSLETERYIWSPENTTMALQGFLLDLIEMPAGKLDREWFALLVRTTKECEVRDPADEETTIKLAAGVDVLVPVTERLKEMGKLAQLPNHVYEVRIVPKVKTPIGGGKTMWRYTVHAKKEPVSRDSFGPMFASVAETPHLPPAEDTSAGGYNA